MADPEWVADGKLTGKGVDELKSRLPFADLSKLEENPAVDRIGDLYTVDMLVQYVQNKLVAPARKFRSVPLPAFGRLPQCDGSGLISSWSFGAVSSPARLRISRWRRSTCTTTFPGIR